MLVYGDHQESADPRQAARLINRRLDAIEKMRPGIERHAALAAALVEGGQLLQGIADADFDKCRRDRRTVASDEIGAFLLRIGHALCRSWDSRFAAVDDLPALEPSAAWPAEVLLKLPEGFAFYALYPEAYVEAARRMRLSAPPKVIGIRSIGTSLAAVVAAALGAPAPVTVRPFGDPYAREIALDETLERHLLHGDAHYVIVDEGPGQSGSSFAAVAQWLRLRGVSGDRIALVPSHAGPPGPAATDERRTWWKSAQRQVGDFGERWLELIRNWCEASLESVDGRVEDVSGGAWRTHRFERDQDWPAALGPFERRKFLLRSRGSRFVAKFAGIGAIGEEKLSMARTLAEEGLVPEPVGLAHGYLIERWREDAAPLSGRDIPVEEVGRYIGTRARLLPAMSDSGASAVQLLAMIRRNVECEFGGAAADALRGWDAIMPRFDRRIVRVRTDNKLDRHEWLRTRAGALIKTDALDHHQAHDLIGCQDVAWDVAGAIVEFDLDRLHSQRLIAIVEEVAGRPIDRELLAFYCLAYCAFRMGLARLGSGAVSDPKERTRIARQADRYAAELQHLLESTGATTRPNSLVG